MECLTRKIINKFSLSTPIEGLEKVFHRTESLSFMKQMIPVLVFVLLRFHLEDCDIPSIDMALKTYEVEFNTAGQGLP